MTPPRTGERTLLGVENLLASIAVPEPFSLELAGDANGVTLYARCQDGRVFRGQLAAHYPQARIAEVAPEHDPLRLDEGERAWTVSLRPAGPEYVPLRTFRDADLTDPGSDPLIALLGALSGLHGGERVAARLLLRSLGPGWAEHHQRLVTERAAAGAAPPPHGQSASGPQGPGIGMAVLGVGALAVLKGYEWLQAGEPWKAALMGLGLAAGLVAAGWVKARFFKRPRAYDPALIREKVSRIAFDAEVRVTAVLPAGALPERAEELLEAVAAAYRHYDNPAGASFAVGKTRPAPAPDRSLEPAPPGLFGRRSVIGVREAAALWHPPGPGDESPLVEPAGAGGPAPAARGAGAPVGDTTAGRPREVRFPADLLGRHHFYVARTRMGKSTLMHHVVTHKLREKAAGRDPDAIVVVDPHADLVEGLLEHVPESLIDRVRLIDLADETGSAGINLLDARIFTDRDRTADGVVRVARGLWEQWGPRMQSILEHVVKSLHEANTHPATDPAGQYTILDGLPLLSDGKFRMRVLARVSDPYILEWWARDFGGWRREYRAEALAPVQTRLAYYASSKRARAILGQRISTFDLRRTILEGGILFVSTAQGAVGRDVAALVGASLLNLVDAVIREQGSLPLAERRGALVVVDEMQSMSGVDYESMLSELGKFGASFILATQSLAKLEDLSRTMQDTVLANIGCLAVFQVAGSDARRLVWELGRERVSEDDVTSLPVHHCYVRATVEGERLPAFSMMVRRPEAGDPGTAALIRAEMAGYTTAAAEIAARERERQRQVDRFRDQMAEEEGTGAPPGEERPDASAPRREQASRRRSSSGEEAA
ncbi:MAG: type IV secretion system DNA-binding domain-containing protein [Chloroflexi bacterium]|nr:type IV secretion system DNA-binding domain-containing protein [Chloroflexota bacterium]